MKETQIYDFELISDFGLIADRCFFFSSLQAEKAEGFINLSGFTIEQAKQCRKKQYGLFPFVTVHHVVKVGVAGEKKNKNHSQCNCLQSIVLLLTTPSHTQSG